MLLRQTATLVDCLTQFNIGRGKAVGDAGKMENVLSCLSSYSIEVPVAFQIGFFREKTQDKTCSGSARWMTSSPSAA